MRLSKLKEKKWIMILIVVINVCIIMGRRFVSDISVGEDMVIPVSGLQGAISVLVFLLGIITIFIDYKKGVLISIIFLVVSSAGALSDIVKTHNFSTLPGVLNSLFFILALYLIAKQLELNDKYNITDHVTGLTNRYGFEEELKKKNILKGNYIVYIHPIGMGKINTNMGRSYFDDCMRIIATRIQNVIKESGKCYKLEGVDYAVIIPNGTDHLVLINSALDSIDEKLELVKNNVTVNCYIKSVAGVVNCGGEDASDNYKEVMRYADIAMHKAIRANNRDRICEFNNEIRYQIERENRVEHMIKDALADETFYLVYQPQYLIEKGMLRGFEALLRLRLEDGTIISPAEFIAVAEKSDLIIEIDKYVLRMAMEQFKDVLSEDDDKVLSVNVSAKDIASPDFTTYVHKILDETKFPANCLEIEITEYSLAESLQNTLDNINELRKYGVKIALDDFGTGYTSLAQLINLPVDLLKIDKSLIDNVEESNQNRDFISSVIYMGHLMECEVIAEGVENEEQLDILKWLECDFVQGFVKNRPLPYEQAVKLLGK